MNGKKIYVKRSLNLSSHFKHIIYRDVNCRLISLIGVVRLFALELLVMATSEKCIASRSVSKKSMLEKSPTNSKEIQEVRILKLR